MCNLYACSFLDLDLDLDFFLFLLLCEKEEGGGRRVDYKTRGQKGRRERQIENTDGAEMGGGGEGKENHTDPNKMSLSASFPGATPTISLLVATAAVVVALAVDILANCSAAFLSLDKVVRLLLTVSVIRMPPRERIKSFLLLPPSSFYFPVFSFLDM